MEQREGAHAPTVSGRGFTLTEALVTIAIMGVLLSLAFPAAGTWLENTEYRLAARDVLNVLQAGRSRAISMNREHRVTFDRAHNRFRLLQGNRPTNSSTWDVVVVEWTSPPAPVRLNPNIDAIHLNTNGTASGGTVSIEDGASRQRYEIRIARTGRFRIAAK